MAASVTGILSSLGLSEDSSISDILQKLIDYNLVTTDELHNIQNISVKPLPNIVRNQADILKQRMYGIATDEDYGLPIVINRRMVLTRYILDKLNIKLNQLETNLSDGTLIVNKAYNDELGNNIKNTYETKVDATTEREKILNTISKLDRDLTDGNKIVDKSTKDHLGNQINTTYETKLNANSTKTVLEEKITIAQNTAKNYTDDEITKLYNLILGEGYEKSYDTFKEIADYISSDKTGASQMLASINANTSEINSLKTNKANSSDVYNRTIIDSKVAAINAKIDEVQTGNSTELANYYNKTQSDGRYVQSKGSSASIRLDDEMTVLELNSEVSNFGSNHIDTNIYGYNTNISSSGGNITIKNLSSNNRISVLNGDRNVITGGGADYTTVGNTTNPTKVTGYFTELNNVNKITAPTESNESTYGAGSSGQVLTSNGSSVYWGTLPIPTKTSQLTNDSGFTNNVGTVTSVKVGTTSYNPSSGVISLPAYPTKTSQLTNDSNYAYKSELFSKNYNDLTNKPTIPPAYTLPTASSSTLGGVKVGSNITVSNGTISLSKTNVTNALGYTPPTSTSTGSVYLHCVSIDFYFNGDAGTLRFQFPSSSSSRISLKNLFKNGAELNAYTETDDLLYGIGNIYKGGSEFDFSGVSISENDGAHEFYLSFTDPDNDIDYYKIIKM